MKKDFLIVFDFFGVFSVDVASLWVQKKFTPKVAMEITNTLFVQGDSGEIALDELYIELAKIANISLKQVKNEWDKLVQIDYNVINTARVLKKTYYTALLTNAPSPLVRNILTCNGLLSCFDEIIISSEVKMIKPNPEIFKFVLEKFNKAAHQAVMIDDNINNINTARKLGFSTIHFTSNTDLEKEIRNCRKITCN